MMGSWLSGWRLGVLDIQNTERNILLIKFIQPKLALIVHRDGKRSAL